MGRFGGHINDATGRPYSSPAGLARRSKTPPRSTTRARVTSQDAFRKIPTSPRTAPSKKAPILHLRSAGCSRVGGIMQKGTSQFLRPIQEAPDTFAIGLGVPRDSIHLCPLMIASA